MIEKNVTKILKLLKSESKVLDIGGWAIPFKRADYVIDIQPYETRGFLGSQGGEKENFSKKTWIIQDVCSREKLPFKDKEFDFVICSHTLEDIRDPIYLCSEIIRIGKRGYIEVPSKITELTKGVANKRYCGYYHHRWIIDILKNKIIFRHKPHLIHSNWKFQVTKRFYNKLDEGDKFSYLFWDNSFNYSEIIQISRDEVEKEIIEFIKEKKVYSPIKYKLDKILLNITDKFLKLKKKLIPQSYYHKIMKTKPFESK